MKESHVKRWYCEGNYTNHIRLSDALVIDNALHQVVSFESLVQEIIKDIEVTYKKWLKLNNR